MNNAGTADQNCRQSELKQRLMKFSSDTELVQSLYLNVLARHATEPELQRERISAI